MYVRARAPIENLQPAIVVRKRLELTASAQAAVGCERLLGPEKPAVIRGSRDVDPPIDFAVLQSRRVPHHVHAAARIGGNRATAIEMPGVFPDGALRLERGRA